MRRYSSRPRPLWVVLAAGCSPAVPTTHDCDLSRPHAVVATTDFQVGVLAAVTDDGCVADELSSTSGDAVVRATSERVWVLNRTGGDALLAYAHGDYQRPVLELGAYRGLNPHDLVRVGDRLFLSLYDRAELVVLDANDGSEVAAVDLSAWADDDGLPEADALRVRDGDVFLSLQRLDRHGDGGWVPEPSGRVVRIDPESLGVIEEWSTGPNPKMTSFDQGLAVMSGSYFEPDGALEVLRTSMSGPDAFLSVLQERDVDLDFGGGAAEVVLGTSFDVGGDATLGCVDEGVFIEALRSDAWFSEAADGRSAGFGVLVASREGWSGSGAGGLWSVDPEQCEARDLELSTLLDPFSVAVVP